MKQAHWTHVVDYVDGRDRLRAVSAAWESQVNPYGDDLREVTAAELARRIACGSASIDENAAPFTEWADRHDVTDIRRVEFAARWGSVAVTLDPLLTVSVAGRPMTVLLHTGKRELSDRAAAAVLGLVRQVPAQASTGSGAGVLDVRAGRLVTEASEEEIDAAVGQARGFESAWRRLDALWTRLNLNTYLPAGTDMAAWQLSQVPLESVRDVLDVGCGPGRHTAPLAERGVRVTGLDPSLGAVRRAAQLSRRGGFLVGDLANLPIRSDSNDLVIAMHMLYNLPDLDQALREVRRVLRPAGVFAAATSSEHHLREVDELFDATVRSLSGDWVYDDARGRRLLRFSAENGAALLHRHFENVERGDIELPLRITEGEAALRYLDSMREWREANLPRGVTWSGVMEQARRRVRNSVAESGFFAATLRESVFLCR